jgi:hypothetical protein
MSRLVFSLGSDDAALAADRELRRNGVKDTRILDRLSRNICADAANDPEIARALDREVALGRVLLEVEIDESNRGAVERVIGMIAADARRFLIPADGTASRTAANDAMPA